MSAPPNSNAQMLEIQLRKWMARGRIHNVTLRPACAPPSVPPGESVVAELIARNGYSVCFTSNGFTLPGAAFIAYSDIIAANWISTHQDRPPRKREAYDRIELSLRDGSSATLADLDQAAFPLLRFFRWISERRKHADS